MKRKSTKKPYISGTKKRRKRKETRKRRRQAR